MFIMTTVASLCAVLLIANLMALACRQRPDLWITSENAILCFVSPVAIMLLTFGGVALGYRLTHGGLGAVSTPAWIGAVLIAALSFVAYRLAAARIRESGGAKA